jgi:HAD superfamily hydrolase (TIGR01509 family)
VPTPSNPTPGAVIFDMDGTLFDSENTYFHAFKTAFAEQGGKLTRADYFRTFAGTTNAFIEQSLAARAPAPFSPARFAQRWRALLDEEISRNSPQPFPGILNLLTRLRDAKIPIALASSSDSSEIQRLLLASGLLDFFPIRIGGDQVTSGKPDPQPFLLAAEKLGISPARCVVFEDSIAGITAAKRAGMTVIHVHRKSTTPHAPQNSFADITLSNITELPWDRLLSLLGINQTQSP